MLTNYMSNTLKYTLGDKYEVYITDDECELVYLPNNHITKGVLVTQQKSETWFTHWFRPKTFFMGSTLHPSIDSGIDHQFSNLVKKYCKTKFPNATHLWLSTSTQKYKLQLFASGYLTFDLKKNTYEIIEFGSGVYPVIDYQCGRIISKTLKPIKL